jgi:N-acetylneuraminate lyase
VDIDMPIPKKLWISGLVAATFTPLHKDGRVNLDMIPTIVDHLISDGVNALYVCGSTGEGSSLTREERKLVAQTYLEATDNRIPLIVQVGHNSLSEAQQLANHAGKIGAQAISAVPPLYFKPHNLDILIRSLSEISTGAPELPFYYYHIPRLTGVYLDMVEFLRASVNRFPQLAGIKYSDFKIFELQACLAVDGGRYNMLFGSDEMLLSGLSGGAHGAIGTSYNFAAPLYKRIIAAFDSGDVAEARMLQGLSIELIQTLNRYGRGNSNLAPMKAVMKILGMDCGPMRLPMVGLGKEETLTLERELRDIGFFDWGRN